MSTTKPSPPTPPTPPSPSPPRTRRLERSTNPAPPRRKSCLACVRAKRRCDQRLPACVRCAQRRIPCERVAQYGQHSSRLASEHPRESGSLSPPPPPPPLPPDPEPMEITLSPGQMGRDVGQGVPMNVAAGEDIDMTFLEGPWDADGDGEDGRFGNGLFEFVAEPSLEAQPVDSMHWTTDLGDMTAFEEEASASFFSSQTPRANAASASTDVLIRPPLELATSRSFNVEVVSRLLENNLSYAVGKMKSAPQQMLLELETPWCHALLYKDEMPRVMQDALSACALYASKTAINSPLIMRCIDAKLNDLLRARSEPLAPAPADLLLHALARTQALLLYQIVRFFDGDIVTRASAEATFGELEASADALARHIAWDDACDMSSSSSSSSSSFSTRAFWRAWICQESARRTHLIARFLTHAWRLLTGRRPPRLAGEACHQRRNHQQHQQHQQPREESWTLSARLWGARDAVAFAAAWRDVSRRRTHHVVRRGTVMGALEGQLAGPGGEGELEVFGKMLLTVSLGVEEAGAWLAERGGSL